jgi:glycosyltransferase involved in cell wall biosynthesis
MTYFNCNENQTVGDFSVLMAVYHKDNPRLFERALISVYENTCVPKQFVLVQDGPISRALVEVIERYKQKNGFEHLTMQENSGLSKALNRGLKVIKTNCVFRADADDFNLENRFASQLKLLESGYDLVGSAILEVDQDGTPLAYRIPPLNHSEIVNFIRRRNPFNHMTIACRTSILKRAGGYPDVLFREDYALWAILISQGAKICNSSEVLVHATAGDGMYKRRGGLLHIRSEFKMQKILVMTKLQSPFVAFFIGVSRTVIFLLPSELRRIIYKKFLRDKLT